MAKPGNPGQVGGREGFEPGRRLGPLQGQQHPVTCVIGDAEALVLQVVAQPGGVGLGAGGVDHHDQLVGAVLPAAVVDDQVVADAAGVVEQHRVAGLAGANPKQVAGHQALQEILGAGTPQLQHPHVRDVEDAAAAAHGLVLGHQTGELHGHLPAGKGHHAATGSDRGAMKWRGLQAGHGVRRQGGLDPMEPRGCQSRQGCIRLEAARWIHGPAPLLPQLPPLFSTQWGGVGLVPAAPIVHPSRAGRRAVVPSLDGAPPQVAGAGPAWGAL